MNKHFSRLLHSLLIVGALLPLSPIASFQLTATQSRIQTNSISSAPTSEPPQFLAARNGLPAFRDGGGTR